jgi:uncharacterized membrane protein
MSDIQSPSDFDFLYFELCMSITQIPANQNKMQIY